MNIERFCLNFTMYEVDEKADELLKLLKELRLKARNLNVTFTLPRRI